MPDRHLSRIPRHRASAVAFPLTLHVGTATTIITPASSDLQDLASAINSQANRQIQATLVNVGSTSSPDYRLSLQATKLGTDAIDLTDSSAADLILPPVATALSSAGSPPVTDPTTSGISNSFPLTLTIGAATPITITPASSDLKDLAEAINSESGNQVQATLVNVGSAGSPDYRLSLQAATPGTGAINLTDSASTDLTSPSTLTTGSLASYQIDGLNTPITSNSRTVTLSTGLTLNLLAQSATGASTTITVADNPAGLASAFSSFAGAYNAAVGFSRSVLTVRVAALSRETACCRRSPASSTNWASASSGSPASALANYGITLDQTGQLSVDTTAFTNAANANFPVLLSTLGVRPPRAASSQTATNLLAGIEDPATGAIKTEESSVAAQITTAQTDISNEQARVNLLQTNLTAQIAQADSAIASLESQVSFVTGFICSIHGCLQHLQSGGLNSLNAFSTS